MRTVKKLLSLFPLLLLWLMLSIFLWGFVFNLITDAPPEQKITLCVDAETPGATELAVELEERLMGAVRMARVRPFSYAMFDSRTLTEADLFIVPASHMETYLDWFAPVPEAFRSEPGLLFFGGKAYGIPAYSAETGAGIAADRILYAPEGAEAEDYYLCFGKESLHNPENDSTVDDAAERAARILLGLCAGPV